MQGLLERLADLSLVPLDALCAGMVDDELRDVVGAYVADLEDAIAEARATLRDSQAQLGAGPDPLGLVERGSEVRTRGAEAAIVDATRRLAERAERRRALALLEDEVSRVLPRLLEADRRFLAIRK
jgi:hypothetical protein